MDSFGKKCLYKALNIVQSAYQEFHDTDIDVEELEFALSKLRQAIEFFRGMEAVPQE